MHINYKAQFEDKPASRGRKSSSARNSHGQDEECEVLDLDREEEEGQAGHSRANRGRKCGMSSHGAREDKGEQIEGSHGRWVKRNNHNVSQQPK